MLHEHASLLWYVPMAGHTWVSATLAPMGTNRKDIHQDILRGVPARVLVPNPGAWREYHPLREEPELFRRFAELEFPDTVEACEEQVRRFADRYGTLDFGPLVAFSRGLVEFAREPDADMRERLRSLPVELFWHFRRGTDLATWYRAHRLLRRAVRVWDALQAGDTEMLARSFPLNTVDEDIAESHFVSDEPEAATVDTLPVHFVSDRLTRGVRHMIGWDTDPADRWPGCPSGPVHRAMANLRQWVNEQLGLHAKLRLRWAPSTTEKMPLRLGVVPETLLGGLWWQLAQAIDGGLRYERCAVCGQWFHVKPRGNRQSTRFCSAYCRLKDFRQEGHKRPKKKAAAR